MSFILKALKKLENEREARKPVPAEINNAILAPDGRSFPGPRKAGWWGAAALLLALCAGLLYLFAHKGGTPVAETRKADPGPFAAAPVAPPRPVVSEARPVVTDTGTAREEGKGGVAERGPVAAVRPKEEERRPVAVRPRRSAVLPRGPVPAVSAQTAPPGFSVSGIAYQDNPAESMAVVNGALVRTGMTVGGAQVEKIFVDRVRFRGSGGTFEVPLAR